MSAVRGVVQCRLLQTSGGSSDADVRTFWHKKLQIFEIFGVSTWTRGVEPLWTFSRQGGGGLFFAILCGRPLWMAP